MATVSTFSGTSSGDIDSLSAVPSATIGSISGITFPSVAAFLLDTYPGAAAGYSVRRLATSATNLMRIREDAGDTETDIGFDINGDLDTAAIAAHCGSADGFVVTWTDQSSNANDAEQAASTTQPQIYDGATTTVILENGKPAISYATSQLLVIASTLTTAASFQLNYLGTTYQWAFPIGGPNSFIYYAGWTPVSPEQTRFRGLGLDLNYVRTLPAAGTQELYTIDRSSGTAAFRINAVTGPTNAATGNATLNTLGDGQGSTSGRYNGFQQEYIFWNTDQSTNRTGIETNINTFFSIYP